MRGPDSKQEGMFSYVSTGSRLPTNHPLRPIRAIVAEALAQMDHKLEPLYAQSSRPSIAPERLIRALLLQMPFTIRSERMLVEPLEYNLLFRWLVGLLVDEPVGGSASERCAGCPLTSNTDALWRHARGVPPYHSTFRKNRDRLFGADIARDPFESIMAKREPLSCFTSASMGALIEPRVPQRSFRTKDDSGDEPGRGRRTWRATIGQSRTNDAHASSTILRRGNIRRAAARDRSCAIWVMR